jgi:hypothetical protein
MKIFALTGLLISGLFLVNSAESTPYWSSDDFKRLEHKGRLSGTFHLKRLPSSQHRFNYLHELSEISAFLALSQVSDSLSPDYGGMREGESGALINIIETDNTAEAIWVWSRYGDLTGDTITYRSNIDAAWTYVMNYPAYDEEGATDYYRIHNCGWALVSEAKYRSVYGDSSFLWYADSCGSYMRGHPLDFGSIDPFFRRLNPLVTGWAAGTLYEFALFRVDSVLRDTALAYGTRVQSWIEGDAQNRLGDALWAMSGGTAMWGVVKSLFEEDSASGVSWLLTYTDSLETFIGTGNWNNSWNIWYANAHRSIHNILGDSASFAAYQFLMDTLLAQDTDEDGGVPASSSDPDSMDQSWTSCYLVFMGIEGIVPYLKGDDVGVLSFLFPTDNTLIVPGDSIILQVEVANHGFNDQVNIPVTISGDYTGNGVITLTMTENGQLAFSPPWIPPFPSDFTFTAATSLPGDEDTGNDSLSATFTVLPTGIISGTVMDSSASTGVDAKLYFNRGGSFQDSIRTSPGTGDYSLLLPIGTYTVRVIPEIPYPETDSGGILVMDSQTTPLDIFLSPAQVLVMDDDEGKPYETYYLSPLESLGIEYVHWDVFNKGSFPISEILTFATPTILWFTGDAQVNTLSQEEQDSLVQFLDSGGNLFLTGQNIGEEINSLPFYSNYLKASLVKNQTDDHILSGIPGNPVGSGLQILTQGSGGAGNQNSQDVIDPLPGGSAIFAYHPDSIAAIGVDTTFRVVYFGFGFEGIHQAPNFAGRDTVLARILEWFGIPIVGFEETVIEDDPPISLFLSQNVPNPFILNTRIFYWIPPNDEGAKVQFSIYDVSGMRVNVFNSPDASPGKHMILWNGRDENGKRVSSGIYFYQLKMGEDLRTGKMTFLKLQP